jgi:hypothetical protein
MSLAAASPDQALLIDLTLDIFSSSLQDFRDAVADIPEHRMIEQPTGLVNHPAWTLAHLAYAAGFAAQLLEQKVAWDGADEPKRYGPGSIPVADASRYASKDAILARLGERHALAEAGVRANFATHFQRPTPEHLRAFAPTIGRIVTYLIATHESYHLGQLMQWRRAVGLTPRA